MQVDDTAGPPNANEESTAAGEIYAVVYDSGWYVGEIVNVVDESSVVVKFMKKQG